VQAVTPREKKRAEARNNLRRRQSKRGQPENKISGLFSFWERQKRTFPVRPRFEEAKKVLFLPAHILGRQKRRFSTLPTFQEPPAGKVSSALPHLEKQKRTAQQGYRQPPAFQQSVRRLLVISV
jgi:hypothetical protein